MVRPLQDEQQFSSKDTSKTLKREATDREKILVKRIASNKKIVSRMYKELLQLHGKKTNSPSKNKIGQIF